MSLPMRLPDLFFAHEGKLSDKWEHYLSIYDAELQAVIARGEPVRLLEVGVQNGGSLEIWARYLPAGSTIVGLDIDPKVGALDFGDHIQVHILDASDDRSIREALGSQTFDIIVDDGSHRSSDIIATFRSLFGRLADGGIYIVEDLHASYWPSHEGGFRLPTSSMEYLKGIVDGLNADHVRDEMDATTQQELTSINESVARIAFYDSVAVIQKLASPKTAPYRRVFSGDAAAVMNPLHQVPVGVLQEAVIARGSQGRIEQSILENADHHRRHAAALQAERDAKADENARLHGDIVALEQRIAVLMGERQQSEAAIAALTEHAAQAQMTIATLIAKTAKPPRGPFRQAMKRGFQVVEKAFRALRSA